MESITAFFASIGVTHSQIMGSLAVAGILVAYIVYKAFFDDGGPGLMERVKDDLFTFHGLITTTLHVFLISGFVTCVILINQAVDVSGYVQQTQTVKGKGK